MKKSDVKIQKIEERVMFGVSKMTNDRTISKDINDLSKEFSTILGKEKDEIVLPFYVLAQDYNPATGNSSLMIGSNIENEQLIRKVMSSDTYAVITIRPKLGFLWGISIGEAKRYFYTKWIKENDKYESRNLEYEYHTEKTIGKAKELDIIFAIKEIGK